MADTIAKIQLRKGVLADLPILDSGEMGYATDAQRLFIGNETITRTGDGTTTDFDFGIDFDPLVAYAITEDGTAINPASITKLGDGTVVRITPAPASASAVVLSYNTEVYTLSPDVGLDVPLSSTLTNQASATSAGITIDPTRYDSVNIEYTLKHTTHVRKGVIRIGIAGASGNVTINDEHTSSTTTLLDHTFSGAWSGSPAVWTLQYTATDTTATTFSYVTKNWKSV
jgi:hypothetical protein